MNTRKIATFLAVFLGAGLYANEASAAKKKGPLEGEPIVRKKIQLRKFRFQLTPYVGMSLSQPFVHMGYVGAKATFHFADWIGVRGTFGYGIVPLESKLLKAVNGGGLPTGYATGETDPSLGMRPETECLGAAPCRENGDSDNPAPLLNDFRAGLVRAQWQASADAVFTPFAGKLGLFSSIFTEYDIYIFGGLGLVNYTKHYDNESTSTLNGLSEDVGAEGFCNDASLGGAQNPECLLHPVEADTGIKVGGSFGGGLNLFAGVPWVAINFEIQDIVTGVNLSGLNATVDDVPPRVNGSDRDVFHNVTFQLGARFYFPFKAKRTD
ncbi:MAG: hypothetical protein ACRBN8_17115 [Nannocystales bacterium]